MKKVYTREFSRKDDPDWDENLRAIYAEMATLTPWGTFARTFLVWAIVLIFALLRGGKGGASSSLVGASCGGGLYWGLFLANMAILGAVTVYLGHRTMTRFELMSRFGHVAVEGDLQWSREATWKYPGEPNWKHPSSQS